MNVTPAQRAGGRLLHRWLDCFVPPALLRASRFDELRRVYLIVAFDLLLALAGIPYAILFWRLGDTASATVTAIAVTIGFAIVLLVRRVHSWGVLGNVTTANLFWVLTALGILQGGHLGAPLLWYAALPLLATTLTGRRGAQVWTAIAIAVLVGLTVLRWAGISPTRTLSASAHEVLYISALVGVLVINLLLAALYDVAKDRMITRIAREQAFSESAINSLPGTFFLIDADQRLVRWNDNLTQLSGHPPAVIATMSPVELIAPDDRDRVSAAIADVFASGARVIEAAVVTTDGQRIPFVFNAQRTIIDGRPYIIGTGLDITARKSADDKLRTAQAAAEAANLELRTANLELEQRWSDLQQQQQELLDLNDELRRTTRLAEQASRSKSEFLANMSHEIRTPMTAILGFVDQLAEECPRQCDFGRNDQPVCIDTITRNGQHLLQVINDILDLSKIEAGQFTIACESCVPADVLRDVHALMQVRAESKGLALHLKLDGAIPARIASDPTRLRQILINLVGNAIKFTETGRVTLSAACPSPHSPIPQIEFTVRDTGIGIGPDQLAGLFEAFSQADNSLTRRFGGTGLGLAISQRLAHMLGGRITVASCLGRGSTFRVTIATGPLHDVPMIADLASSTPATHHAHEDGANEPLSGHVLLAEDGPDNQRLVTRILEKAGLRVTCVENGQLAVDAIREAAPGEFDLVLMDMQMPVMDGYSATRALREQGHTGPIIALTAHAMDGDRERCLAAGCDDYATKPLRPATLKELLQRYLTPHRSAAVPPNRGDSH